MNRVKIKVTEEHVGYGLNDIYPGDEVEVLIYSLDPMERCVEKALVKAGINFVGENDPRANNLDFYLPDFDLHIEVKQFHSPRISGQMAKVPNILVLQGLGAAEAFDRMLNK